MTAAPRFALTLRLACWIEQYLLACGEVPTVLYLPTYLLYLPSTYILLLSYVVTVHMCTGYTTSTTLRGTYTCTLADAGRGVSKVRKAKGGRGGRGVGARQAGKRQGEENRRGAV